MNRYALAIAFATLAAAGQSFAGEITIDTTPFVSTASRAEVQQELARFKASGVTPWAREYDPRVEFRGTKSRAEVTAEYIRSRDAVAAIGGEDSGSAFLAANQREATRAYTVAGEPVAGL